MKETPPCPNCGEPLTEKRSVNGKVYWACYGKCKDYFKDPPVKKEPVKRGRKK